MKLSKIKTSVDYKNLLNKSFTILLTLYVVFITGRAVWLNWKFRQQIKSIENEIIELQNKQKSFENLILYYQSDSFKEIEARRKLGLKKADEKAVAVPQRTYRDYNAEIETQKKAFENQIDENLSNPHSWWNFFVNNFF